MNKKRINPLYRCVEYLIPLTMLKIIIGALPGAQILVQARLIDRIDSRYIDITSIIVVTTVYIVVCFGSWTIDKLIGLLRKLLKSKLHFLCKTQLLDLSMNVNYSELENSENYYHIKRIMSDADTKWCDVYDSVSNVLSLFIKVINILIIIGQKAFISAFILAAAIIPVVGITFFNGKRTYLLGIKAAKSKTKADYYYELLAGRNSSAERGIFGYYPFVKKSWKSEYYKFIHNKEKADKYFYFYAFLTTIWINAATLLSLISLGLLGANGKITIGFFISAVGTIVIFIRSVSSSINFCSRSVRKSLSFCKDYFELFDLVHKSNSSYKVSEKINSIELKNLSFSYPNTNEKIIDNISVKLKGGKKYALVGKNGSGKSTLVKILCGLYSDYQGKILINGEVELRDYLSRIGVVFQDFGMYKFSIADNICMGSKRKEDKINEVLKLVGLKDFVDNLPDGLDTELGKIYINGIELSTGQWQRLALARLLYSSKDLCILDEPTASLDPEGENFLFSQFKKICGNRTVLFISHRLGMTKLADTILVLNNHKLEQIGTFSELIQDENGLFYKMYKMQEWWYDKNVEQNTVYSQ